MKNSPVPTEEEEEVEEGSGGDAVSDTHTHQLVHCGAIIIQSFFEIIDLDWIFNATLIAGSLPG